MTKAVQTNSGRKPIMHSLPHQSEVLKSFQETKAKLEAKLIAQTNSAYPDQPTIDRINIKLKEINHLISVQMAKGK